MNIEELKECLQRLGSQQQNDCQKDLEIIWQQMQDQMSIDLIYQIGKTVIELRQYGGGWKLANKMLSHIVKVCLNNKEQLKGWETMRIIMDPEKQIYKCYELHQIDVNQFSHHEFTQYNFSAELQEGMDVDALYDDEKGNVIGWCRGKIEKLNEKYVWVKWYENDDKRKILRYSMDIAPFKSKVNDEEWQWRHSLQPGDIIDCYDNRTWQNATIITILKDQEDIEYIVGFRIYDDRGNLYDSIGKKYFGWNQQYDERIRAVSPRIQKLNTFSKGQYPNPYSQDDSIHDSNDFLYPDNHYAIPRFYTKQTRRSIVLTQMINDFGNHGLFQFILQSIQSKCTIDFLHVYMQILNNIHEMLHKQFVINYIPNLYIAVQNNILQSADNNLRNFTTQKITDVLYALNNLMKRIYPIQKRSEIIDRLDFDIAFKCFNSDFLERKIQGLKAIQELIKRTKDLYIQYGMQESQKQAAIQMILEWLNQKKIFESLYVGSGNSHLVQRSAEFFKFLIEEKMIGIQNLKEIWNNLDKAEYEHKLAIHKLFKDVSNSLEKEWLEFLINEICNKDPKEVTKDELDLLLDIVKSNHKYKEEYIQNCCNYYWTVLQKGQLNQTLFEQYLGQYLDLVTSFDMRPHKGEQILMIGESIVKQESTCIGLRVLIKLIEKLDISPATWEQYTRNVALSDLQCKFGIIEEVINQIRESKKQKDSFEDIKVRMQFIQIFYQNISTYEYRLTFKVISTLWELLVFQSESQQEKDLVFKWFSTLSNQDGQSQLTSMVSISELKTFLIEKMTNDLAHLTEEGFSCFKTVLSAINKYENFGFDYLWQIILEGENEKVSLMAIEYCHQFEINIERLFNKLQENKQQNNKLLRCLLVLEDFIDQSEINGVGNLKSLNALSQGEELQIQIQYENSQQKRFTIKINDNQTIVELRFAISKVIKQQWDAVGLNSLKGEIKFTENGKMIKDLRLKKGEILMVFKKQVKEVKEMQLLDGDNLSEQAKVAFTEIFNEFSTDGKMTKEDCTRFVTGCTGNPCSIEDANIQRTFEQYDKDKDSILTLQDFFDFYTDSARSKKSTVWLNLQTLHYRNDLIRGDKVPLPQINAQELPRGQIVQNQEYLDLLFELLQNSNSQVQEKTWYLLRRLPPSPQLIKQMITLENITKPTDWDQMLVSSHYRLLYSLYIIEFLMNQQDSNNLQALIEDQDILRLKDKWMSKFLQLGGFDRLLQLFKEYQGKSVSTLSQIEKEILSFLLNTFQNYVIAACASQIPNLYKASRGIQIIKPLDQVLLDIRQSEEPEKFQLLVQKLKESQLGNNIIEKIENFISVLINLIQELLKCNEMEQEDRQIIEHSIIIIIVILLHNHKLLEKSIENVEFINIFFSGIFNGNSDTLRNLFSRAILVLCHESQKNNNQPTRIILQQLITMQNSQANSAQYYELLSQLIDSAFESEESQQFIDYQQLSQQMLQNLINYKSQETRSKNTPTDKILIGLLNLLCKLSRFIQQPIIDLIFNDCLFSQKEEIEIKCKSIESRQAAFKLLNHLAQQQNMNKILINLQLLSQKIPNTNKWNYIPQSDVRSALGYCGIKNLRCICYMNAMLQQFYMIKPFRYGILQANDNKEVDLQLSKTGFTYDDNVLHQLQQMFTYLELSDRIDYNPQEFCASFKDYAGEPVNIFIQQDAQEFLNMIFDKLEHLLKETLYKNILDGVFGGKTCTQISCQNCKVTKSKDEIFYNLSLPIKNLKNLQECFDKFVQGEIISDFKCESCNQKVDVNKCQLLAQLPNILILHLQRIVFNLDTFMNEKINTRLEFPIDLDLQEYTIKKDQCTQYKLVGVVVHVGTADVGHYFSYIDIKNQDQWLEFNDHKIKEFKLKQMEHECFGGSSSMDYNDNDVWGTGFRENSQSAYMLIYEKVQKDQISLVFNSEQQLQDHINQFENYTIDPNQKYSLLVDYNSLKPYIPQEYERKVNCDNQQFLLERNLFSQDFLKFILDTSEFINEENANTMIEVLMKFNYDLLSRVYDNSMMEKFNTKILQLIQQYPNINYLDLVYFGKLNKVVDLLLVCPESRTRKHFSKLLSILFNQTIQIQGQITEKLNEGLDQLFLMIQDQVPKNWIRYEQYFDFWLDFIQGGKLQQEYSFKKKMVLYMVDFILDKSSPLQLYEKKVQMGNAYVSMNFQIQLQIVSILLTQNHQLSLNEKKLLYSPKFYDKIMKSKVDDIIPIIIRLSYKNRYFSEIISGCIMRGLVNTDIDECKNYLQVAKSFLLIEDYLQIERLEWLVGIPSSKQKESSRIYDNQLNDLPQFGLYGLQSLDDDYWSFSSPLGWSHCLFDYFCTHRTVKNFDNQCLLTLKCLLQLSVENQTCFNYIANLPCVNYLYKHNDEIFKAFLDIYIQDTKRFCSQYPRKLDSDETKILLEEYQFKLNQIHDPTKPQYDYIIGKSVEVRKITKLYYLFNPATKQESIVDEDSPNFNLIKSQIDDGTLHKVITLEEKVYTTHICDNLPNGQTNESLPELYVKGTQLHHFSVDPNSEAANFIQSKAWNVTSDDNAVVSNPKIAETVKQIQLQNNTNRNLHVILEIKGSQNTCHYIPTSKIQSLMNSKIIATMFTAIKKSSLDEFPKLEFLLSYKKQEPRSESYLYISNSNEMNLELL
ncbi:unnamed protein product [Paramecium sonneborni]|uniref:Ubiquitinyl hydrolase 1 n=1 Tax=Paramecium sonneborni TaxID=65129 RepID=A0A8S1QYR7_9CILI|nr:unnamed protein product [Paramecium sonneborni]